MSTTLAKSYVWSLGVDEGGPLFDEISKDWRHSIFLTKRGATKEIRFASESPENQRLLLAAMTRETLPLMQGDLRMLRVSFPELKIAGTRWVFTPKEPDYKARLVVQGFQEDPIMMRTDSPTGSGDSFFLVLCCAAQEHWSCGSADAASAYFQAAGIERLLLLEMPRQQPPPGREPG